MKKLLCAFLLLVSACVHFTLAGAASVTLGQAGAGGVSAIIAPDPGEIGRPATIWIGAVWNGTLYLRDGPTPTNWAEYRGGALPIALTSAALPSSLQVSIVNFDISSLHGVDVYVGYGRSEADLSLSGHLAKVYTVPTPVATAVGVVTGSAASATIGVAGGSVSMPDGKIVLTIPAGALASNTVISIQPVTNYAHGGLGAGYRLTPDGQTFAQPVVLTFSYTDQDLAGSDPEILGAAFQTAAGYWQWLGTPTIDSVAKTMRISTTHFTDISMVQGLRLTPSSKRLNVNESLALQVAFCYPRSIDPGDELQPLGLECETAGSGFNFVAHFDIGEWSVNGIAGGNGTVGTVNGNGPSATYRAPATKPTPNIVAVSARVNLGTLGKALVVSNITITDLSKYIGTVHFSVSPLGVTNGIANVTWTQFEDLGDTRRYVPSGTMSADIALPGGACDPIHATVPLYATVPHGIGPTMVVYTATNSRFANRLNFSLDADQGTLITFTCGGVPVPSPAPIGFGVGVCSSSDPQPFSDEAHLTGTYSCPQMGTNATWDFTAQ